MIPISPRFRQALDYAATLHAEHTRKGSGIAYVSHLLGVAALAIEYGANEDEAIAALLHDAVEDQGGPPTLEAIRKSYGDEVARIVDACSDTDEVPKPPWKERKEAYLEHLESADESVRLVSCCDKIHNLRAILSDYRHFGSEVFDRFKAGQEGTMWYYAALSETFTRLGPERPASDFANVLSTLQTELGKATDD